MTVLLTKCPYCDSNFMILDTDRCEGSCVMCFKQKKFDENEVKEAESTRDSLADKYLSRLEKIYENKDLEAMAPLAEEIASEGISSWYAWFCVGWFDLHSNNVESAMEDFRLAVLFLDEENFDEFYELAMEEILDSIQETTSKGEMWASEDLSMISFTGSLFERFEHLCDMDFMTDLMLRIGYLADEIDKASTACMIIREMMLLSLDYMSGNTFVLDRQMMLNNARQSTELLVKAVEERSSDGSLNPSSMKFWGPGFIEFTDILLDMGGRMISDFDEEQMLQLCDYWSVEDYGSVFGILQNAFEYHLNYVTSAGRNKGMMKKRDKALEDYDRAFRRPLDEGLIDPDQEEETEFDCICPECGECLNADETGFVKCKCGFTSRIVTDDVLDLPESVPQLIAMGREALKNKDSMLLNNIGERILEFDEGNWFGYLCLGESCLLDDEIGVAIMMFYNSAEGLPTEGVDEYTEVVIEGLGNALNTLDSDSLQQAIVLLPALFETVNQSPAKDRNIVMALLKKMIEGSYNRSDKGLTMTMMIPVMISFEVLNRTSITYQRNIMAVFLELLDAIEAGMNEIKRDADGYKTEVLNVTRTIKDLLKYTVKGIDSRSEDMDEEKKGYISGHWGANKDEYQEIVKNLMGSFSFDEDIAYKANSNQILKSKHLIDVYLDSYFDVEPEN